jgi:ATP-dependent DNA ligase
MRREPIETRKATPRSILRRSSLPGVRLNEHIAHPMCALVFQHACKLGADGIVSKRLGSRYRCRPWRDSRGGRGRQSDFSGNARLLSGDDDE